MNAEVNPYAAFGGNVLPQPAAAGGDPYSAFGGGTISPASTPEAKPAPTNGQYPLAAPQGQTQIGPSQSGTIPVPGGTELLDKLTNPVGALTSALDDLRTRASSLNPDVHPYLSKFGQLLDNAKELLVGNEDKPMGMQHGVLDEAALLSGGPAGEALEVPEAAAKAAQAAKDVRIVPRAARASQSFSELEKTIGTHPVGVDTNLSKSVNELKEAVTTTNTNLPPVVRKLIDRLDPFQGAGDLTYKEGRAFSSEIGNLAQQDKMSMTANTKRLVGNLDRALTDAVQHTADLAGQGEKLASAMKEYHNAMRISGLVGKARTYALRTAIGVGGWKALKELGLFD